MSNFTFLENSCSRHGLCFIKVMCAKPFVVAYWWEAVRESLAGEPLTPEHAGHYCWQESTGVYYLTMWWRVAALDGVVRVEEGG